MPREPGDAPPVAEEFRHARAPEPQPLSPADCDPERLAVLLARALSEDACHGTWGDERLLEWLAVELRDEDPRTRRRTDTDFMARDAALRARAAARRHQVIRRNTAPVVAEATRGTRTVPLFGLGVAAGVGRDLWDEPPEEWVELPDVLPGGEYLALRIVGTSMNPLLHSGDTVLLKRGPQVRRDSVIVARHPADGYVCKRVHSIRRSSIVLTSLEAGNPDITIPRDESLILGTVLLVWCEHRRQ